MVAKCSTKHLKITWKFFDDFIKILEWAINKENERTTTNNIDQFEYSQKGDYESGDCSIEESEELITKSILVDQFQEI